MRKFEYKSFTMLLSDMNDETMNSFGDDGWELVHVSESIRLDFVGSGPRDRYHNTIWKREKYRSEQKTGP